MPAIDGLASGFDTTALINAITGVTAAQKLPLERRVGELQDRVEKLAELSSRLGAMADLADGLVDPDTLLPLSAHLSAEGQLAVRTGESDLTGSFQVQVHTLARGASLRSAGFADPDALGAIGEGTLTVSVGGIESEVVIDGSNSSLQGLADALDAVDGIRAYVVDTGASADPYRIVVLGEQSGAAHAVTVDSSGLVGADPAIEVLSQAADAHLTLDGLDLYSATNAFEDVLPGVSFDAQAVGADAVTLTLARDVEGLGDRLQSFVDAYNEVIGYHDAQTAFNPEAGIRGGLVGEASARRVVDELGGLVVAAYAGAGELEALSQLGLSTGRDGKLTLDRDALAAALDARYDDVVGLLTAEDGPLAAIRDRVRDVYVDADGGVIASRTDTVEELIADTRARIEALDGRVAREAERLRARFTSLELTMARLQSTSSFLVALMAQPSSGSSSS